MGDDGHAQRKNHLITSLSVLPNFDNLPLCLISPTNNCKLLSTISTPMALEKFPWQRWKTSWKVWDCPRKMSPALQGTSWKMVTITTTERSLSRSSKGFWINKFPGVQGRHAAIIIDCESMPAWAWCLYIVYISSTYYYLSESLNSTNSHCQSLSDKGCGILYRRQHIWTELYWSFLCKIGNDWMLKCLCKSKIIIVIGIDIWKYQAIDTIVMNVQYCMYTQLQILPVICTEHTQNYFSMNHQRCYDVYEALSWPYC